MKRTSKPWAVLPHLGQQGAHRGGAAGFTLLELLIVLLVASGLALVCFNALLADGQLVGSMAEGWRQRQERERALDLIRHDLLQGDDVWLDPRQAQHRCSMRRRRPVLGDCHQSRADHLCRWFSPLQHLGQSCAAALWTGLHQTRSVESEVFLEPCAH